VNRAPLAGIEVIHRNHQAIPGRIRESFAESRFILGESEFDSTESGGTPREDSLIWGASLWITAQNVTLTHLKWVIFVKI
jgi:hypothetical protein